LSAVSDYFLASQWTPVLLQLLLLLLLSLRPAGITAEQPSGQTDSQDSDKAESRLSRWSSSFQASRRWLLPGLVGLLLSFPIINALLGWNAQTILLEIGVFMLLALGLNFLLGWAGLLDLGYLVGCGIGAYLTALLLPAQIDFVAILGLSAALAGAFGILKGQLALRLRHDYLAVAMLTLGLMLPQVITNLDWTGGIGGIAALPSPQILGHQLSRPVEKYYLIVALMLGVIWSSRRLLRSTIGRAWRASSFDEVAALSCGIDVAAYRTLAFALSSAVAGMAGALYVGSFAYIAPDLLEFPILAMVLAMVILGGIGNLAGALLGALLVVSYDKLFIPWLGQALLPLLPQGLQIGTAPDLRGVSYFSFGLAIYLTVLWRFRQRDRSIS
jgi:branched-chain amino acid transport system permease protein